ncbi:MAG: hypothetical protein ACYDEV_16600 [Acidiferrobacter sp.]
MVTVKAVASMEFQDLCPVGFLPESLPWIFMYIALLGLCPWQDSIRPVGGSLPYVGLPLGRHGVTGIQAAWLGSGGRMQGLPHCPVVGCGGGR